MHIYKRVEESVRVVAKFGYQGIEYWASAPYSMLDSKSDFRKSIAKQVHDSGIESVSICPDYSREWWRTGLGLRPTANPKEYVKLVRRNIELAAELGCSRCNLHSMTLEPGIDAKKAFDNLIESFTELAEVASDYGLILCHEPEPGMAFSDPQSIKRMLDRIDGSNFGILYDTALMHVISSGRTIQLLEELKQRIVHVHLADQGESINRLGEGRVATTMDLLNERVPLGQGRVDLKGILHALSDAGYEGWIGVEPAGVLNNSEDAALTSRKFVEQTVANEQLSL